MGENRVILALVIVIMLLISDQHCAAESYAVKKNKSVVNISKYCGGSGSDKECLPISDDEMEFLMDSEASKRVLATFTNSKYPTVRALDAGSAACGRNSGNSCVPNSNPGRKVPPNCSPSSYSKDCHRF